MKNKKIAALKISLIVLSLFLSFQVVKGLGVTRPIPVDLKLLRGDSARFYFQIQARTSATPQVCSYSVTGMDPLIITFDEESVTVDAGEIKNVYGTITAPSDTPFKSYEGQLLVTCKPQVGFEGASGSVIQQNMGVKFTAEVVATLPKGPTTMIYKPSTPTIPSVSVLGIIIIVIAVIGIYYWSKKK